jgi:hypothetical protein
MDDRAGQQMNQRREPDLRMRPHVDALPEQELVH